VPQDKDSAAQTAHRSEGRHAAPEGAGVDPLIDLNRDPTPGVPDHAKPEDD
jgi:hypothetical protein